MDKIELLKEYLLSDNVGSYENEIIGLIPVLANEINFDQKNDWHNLDVWNHTLEAIRNCDYNFEDRLALLFHDVGKPLSFQEEDGVRHFAGHEKLSAEIAYQALIDFGLDPNITNEIVLLILEHATPIQIENINDKNYDYYKRLLKIQKCDALAYEPEHAMEAMESLVLTEIAMCGIKGIGRKRNK